MVEAPRLANRLASGGRAGGILALLLSRFELDAEVEYLDKGANPAG